VRRGQGLRHPHPLPSPEGRGRGPLRGAVMPWFLLGVLLAAGPVLAQTPPANAPAPAQPTEEEADLGEEEEGLDPTDGGVAEEEELPPEEEEEEYAEEDLPEEVQPAGYSDSTGNMDSLDDSDGLRVSVRAGVLRARRGYTPLEVVLHNTDPAPRPVRLIFRGYGSGSPSTTRTVELAGHQRLTTYLLVPAPVQGGTFSVEGPRLRPRATGVYLDEPGAISTLVLGQAKAFEAGTSMTRSDDNRPPLVDTRFLSAQDAPRELAAYVGYDAVVVTEDVTTLPADVWGALENYAAVGGSLLLARPPRDVKQRLPMLSREPEGSAWNRYGLGKVYLCNGGPLDCGVALIAVSDDARPLLLPVGPAPRWESNRSALRGGELPLLPNALAPVGRFLVVIFLFSLVVGPGGLLLARRKGPAAMLIGVPAVALFTCLLIVADSVLGDGFVTHASRYSYTLLDRPRDRAVTAAVAGYYANLASAAVQVPSTGVLLAPDDMEDWFVDVDWAGGGMVADGFLPARTYAEWGELAVVPTRARLVARREGDAVKVQNALGAKLVSGQVRLDGKRYQLPELADGAEGLATEATNDMTGPGPEGLVPAPPSIMRRSGDLDDFRTPLSEREFMVQIDGPGFAPLAAMPVDLREGIHFVRGKVEAP
jgi:hypothetical protein